MTTSSPATQESTAASESAAPTVTAETIAGIAVENRTIAGPHGAVPLRIYRPSGEATGQGLVWLHGGGFWAGDLDMPEGDWVARSFAARGIVVVSVDYRLAPQAADDGSGHDGVHYPVASQEVAFAFGWAVASGLANGAWALGGASAGGNLAAGATLRLMAEGGPVPALDLLAYPTLLAIQPAPDSGLRAALDADPDSDRFGPDPVRAMYENYLDAPAESADLMAAPGLATTSDLAEFPPTIMINGEVDELRVSGEVFAATLRAAGRDIQVLTEAGTGHGYLNRPDEPAATVSIDRYAARIHSLPAPA
ncbi:alpha/beta hydrolase fold domain-containing protein [Planctomonas sp. JC2975]|uniref:alpha/beta hydrolase n=1 Tax=Planctomonas sp. JC2975 TaxID=2729626 RepID=UPI0014742592|nr:alpha/beta hydrolase fold domain-containing protein [Planctomonas sp. JC2975]NNC12776.1 alpha/beta hydrolase fold domain-containing protein [Planctomonas sp. JC2975]